LRSTFTGKKWESLQLAQEERNSKIKLVGGLHERGMHTSLLSMESFHAPSWAPESQADK